MSVKHWMAILSFIYLNSCDSCKPEKRLESYSVTFDDLIHHLDSVSYLNEQITAPDIYSNDEFNIRLVTDSSVFRKEKVIIKGLDNDLYPVSYSIIFEQRIISLFSSGRFLCTDINTFQRDHALEKRLNKLTAEGLWLINQKPIIKRGNRYFAFDKRTGWEPFRSYVPKASQKILFEDANFLISADCYGEFGGTLYFHDKNSKELFFTESTCARSVVAEGDSYRILSSLGHHSGFTDSRAMREPRKLTKLSDVDPFNLSVYQKQHLGFLDSTNYGKTEFDFFGIQFFSQFSLNNQKLYLTYWQDATFVSSLSGNTISIEDPLFANKLYTHNPVTRDYGNGLVLINLDLWRKGKDHEVGMLLINNNKLTHIEWSDH